MDSKNLILRTKLNHVCEHPDDACKELREQIASHENQVKTHKFHAAKSCFCKHKMGSVASTSKLFTTAANKGSVASNPGALLNKAVMGPLDPTSLRFDVINGSSDDSESQPDPWGSVANLVSKTSIASGGAEVNCEFDIYSNDFTSAIPLSMIMNVTPTFVENLLTDIITALNTLTLTSIPSPQYSAYFNMLKSVIQHYVIPITLPKAYTIEQWMPPTFDQLSIGSCASNVVANMIKYKTFYDTFFDKGLRPDRSLYDTMISPGRLYIYRNARLTDGNPLFLDSGSTMAGVFAGLFSKGYFDELYDPYMTSLYSTPSSNLATFLGTKNAYQSQYSYTKLPWWPFPLAYLLPDVYINDAAWPSFRNFLHFLRPIHVQILLPILTMLSHGQPVAFGTRVQGSSLFDGNIGALVSGVFPWPTSVPLEGHAMIISGYDIDRRVFLVQSSWGTGYGLPNHPGFFEISFEYMIAFAHDFYTWTNI
jgi:hypothetical protein